MEEELHRFNRVYNKIYKGYNIADIRVQRTVDKEK
jgi:hypothetical protein